MQLLRYVEVNTQQIINFRAILQAQVARALAALGMKDIRELRGQYPCIEWPLLEKRVTQRRRRRTEILSATLASGEKQQTPAPVQQRASDSASTPSDCGVAAIRA